MKGMSTVVATILMLAITIALSGTAYLYLSGYITGRISTSFSIIDSYQDSVTIMNDGSSPITSFSSVKVDGNDAVYRVSTQDDSTAGYWKFGEGSAITADDSSGKGNTGTIYGATPVDGYFGKALSFDGNDYVDIGDSSLYFSDAVTEDAWSDTDDVLKYGKVLSFDSVANSNTDSFSNGNTYNSYLRFPDIDGDDNILDGSIKRISFDGIDPSLEINVSASADDVQRVIGAPNLVNGTAFDVGNVSGFVNHAAARFTNVNVPQGAIITNAYLSVVSRTSASSSNVLTKLYAENVDNATRITSNTDFDGRILTTGTSWNITTAWTNGTRYNSTNISSEIQTVVNRVGWVSGNAINVFWKDNSSPSGNNRPAASWDSTQYPEPLLFIGYIVAAGDTTPPLRSNGQPTGTLPSGTTSTTISLTTDESATCRYSTTANTTYSSMTNTFTTTGGTSHSTLVGGLTDGNNYNYYVRCNDTAGNPNPDDFAISFSVALPFNFTLSTTPTSGTVVQGNSITTTATATLTSGSTQSVSFSSSGLPSGASSSFTPTSCNPNCSSIMNVTTNGTTPVGTYPIIIAAVGGAVTRNTTYTLTVSSSDTIPPTWSNNQTNSTLAGSRVNHSVVLSDNIGLDYYIFEFWNGTSSGTNISTRDISGITVTANQTVLINSTVGSTIRWRYYFNDTSNNWNRTYLFNYTTTSAADTTPPVRSNGQPTGTLPSGTTSTTISLTTNEAATCRYSAVANVSYSSMTNTFTTTGGTSHSTLVGGLTDGNNYNYYVRCNDTVGNPNTDDFTISFSVASSGTIQPSNHTAVTVEAWINPSGTGIRYILANPYLNTQNSKYAIYVAPNGTLGVAQTSSLGSWNEVRGGVNSVPNGVWTHVAYTWDAAGGLARYYINGNLIGTRADAGTVLGLGGDIRMGTHAYISNGYFNGIIDEVRIYNRSLSEGEIKANFDIGSQINSGQLATIEIYNSLSAGTHTFRICTSNLCSTAYLTIV